MSDLNTTGGFWITPLPNAGLAFAWICFALGICFGFVLGIWVGAQIR